MTQALLELRSISKSFGPTRALRDVSLSIRAGQITALIGENGAGKSTLMLIAAGALSADAGVVAIDGKAEPSHTAPGAPGIEMVRQHFADVPRFTVAENLALTSRGLPLLFPARGLSATARESILRSGLALPSLDRRLSDLSVGERATLELVKALSRNPRILILDEPTSVLTPPEVGELTRNLRRLADNGTAIVFVTHKLREVFEISDRVYVMRGGRMVLEAATKGCDAAELARAMTGQAPPPPRPPVPMDTSSPATPSLEMSAISLALPGGRNVLDGVSLAVRPGEIVGIVGVAGNGQRELGEAVRGLIAVSSGQLLLDGVPRTQSELARSRDIGYIPPDRAHDGLVAELDIAENLALGAPHWKRSRAERTALREIGRYSIRSTGPGQQAGRLSGGNQQKVVLARELERSPRVVVAAEPTRGLDLQAMAFVHARLRQAAADGAAILLITSDLDEALSLAGALHVIYRGRLGPRLAPSVDRGTLGMQMGGLV